MKTKIYILTTLILISLMIGTVAFADATSKDKNQKDYLKSLDKKNMTSIDTTVLLSSCQQNGATIIETDKFIVISAKEPTTDLQITEKDCKKLMKDITKNAKAVG